MAAFVTLGNGSEVGIVARDDAEDILVIRSKEKLNSTRNTAELGPATKANIDATIECLRLLKHTL